MTRQLIAPVSAVADVLQLWELDGWLTPPLSPVVPARQTVIGKVVTITIVSSPTGPGLGPVYSMLSRDLSGRFVVLGGGMSVAGAVWGGIMSTAAHLNDATGVLVDGIARDVPEMTAVGLPVYATESCVVGPNGTAHVVEVGGAVAIGGVIIDPQDSIVADSSGCVRIPYDHLDDVLAAAELYADAEQRVLQALRDGESLTSAHAIRKAVVEQLRR
ncbi:MAG: Demethylmenaquinone methyltransferase-like protein [Ilumatobacteraceae bacterium]|nr:Demethylmenaquinone methyltransferase-like protein [Ilumatobacteraceae bacterium]